jgi:hypothetical protein
VNERGVGRHFFSEDAFRSGWKPSFSVPAKTFPYALEAVVRPGEQSEIDKAIFLSTTTSVFIRSETCIF